jgi:HSP20 family protein
LASFLAPSGLDSKLGGDRFWQGSIRVSCSVAVTKEAAVALARWSPINELSGLHNTMDRLFGEMFESLEGSGGDAPTYRLPVDIKETSDGYEIKAPIAGFKPEQVEVTFSDGVLSIKATHQEEKNKKEGNYVRREVIFGNYQRHIVLPPDVQADKIEAKFDHGLLTVEVPRKAKGEAKRIEVRSSQSKDGGHEKGKQENGKQQLQGAGSQKS